MLGIDQLELEFKLRSIGIQVTGTGEAAAVSADALSAILKDRKLTPPSERPQSQDAKSKEESAVTGTGQDAPVSADALSANLKDRKEMPPSERPESQATEFQDEFALPGRSQTLLLRIHDDLIAPRRQALENANARKSSGLKRAEAEFARSEAHLQSLLDSAKQRSSQLLAEVEALLSALSAVSSHGQEHLRIQGVNSPAQSRSVRAASLGTAGKVDLAEIRARVATKSDQLKTLYEAKRPAFWPESTGARWAIGLGTAALGFVYLPLLLAWPVAVLIARGVVGASLRSDYRAIVSDHSELEASLEHAKQQITSECARESQDATRQVRPKAEAARQESLDRVSRDFREEAEAIEKHFQVLAGTIAQELAALWTDAAFAAKDWSSSDWEHWKPDSSPEFASRIGTVHLAPGERQPGSGPGFEFQVPALIPFGEGKCLLLEGTGTEKDKLAKVVSSALIRVLANTPPGKARFTLLDPVGLGQNVAEFTYLREFSQELIGGQAWTEPQHIEQQLSKITEEMEVVIQTYLRTEYSSLREYNRKNHEIARPFRFLAIYDFPVNFTETSARRLLSIVKNGPRCGVYTFVLRDTAKKEPYGFNIAELQQHAWPGADFLQFQPRWDSPPDVALSRAIIAEWGRRAPEGMKKSISFQSLLKGAEKGAPGISRSAATEIRVPLGPAGGGGVQELVLGQGQAAHALLVGRTGSGKTNLMHVIITNLALQYSPNEVELYLVDFKGGVGFKRYAQHKLPHARVIAIESEREFGMSILRRLEAEFKERSELFRSEADARGTTIDSLASYRAKVPDGKPLRRVLLVVDEFQEFFREDDETALQARRIFDLLARQGRSHGVHFLLATQALSGSAQLPSSILSQIAVRIALPCSDSDARLILADDNKAARALSQPGEAIYNAMAGAIEGNQPFQVALFDEERDLEEHLGKVAALAAERGDASAPIVFEGNELAQLAACKPLIALIDRPEPCERGRTADLFLGEPIALRPPVAARLRRQSGSNLLVLGRDENEGVGMCMAIALSFLAQQVTDSFKLYLFDFTLADSDWANHAEEVASRFPPECVHVIGNQAKVAAVLETIAQGVEQSAGNGNAFGGATLLLFQGFHRVRALRGGMASDEEARATDALRSILREGPELGVHTVAWADTLENSTRGIGRSALNDFGLRVGAFMNAADSSLFFDSAVASKLAKPHRAVYSDENHPGELLTFRPYALPDLPWLRASCSRLASRIRT